MSKKDDAIELLQCALINCDNIRTLGAVGVQMVKSQIQDAVEVLESDEDE